MACSMRRVLAGHETIDDGQVVRLDSTQAERETVRLVGFVVVIVLGDAAFEIPSKDYFDP